MEIYNIHSVHKIIIKHAPPSKVTLESRDSEASRWILQPKAVLRERSTQSLRNDDDNHINIGPGNILFTIGNNFPYCFFHEDIGGLATNYVSIVIAVWK